MVESTRCSRPSLGPSSLAATYNRVGEVLSLQRPLDEPREFDGDLVWVDRQSLRAARWLLDAEAGPLLDERRVDSTTVALDLNFGCPVVCI